MRGILLFVVVPAAVLTAQEPKTVDAASQAAEANNRFACDLYRRLATADGNLCFSPYSVSAALAMTRAGAAGRTASQMDAVLHTGGLDGSGAHRELAGALRAPAVRRRVQGKWQEVPAYQLRIANALWGQQGYALREPFLAGLRSDFAAPLQRVDFREPGPARARINAWVAERTAGKVRDLVPPGLPTPDTRLVLANAIHFRAFWQNRFVVDATITAPFEVAAGRAVKVRMMRLVKDLAYAATGAVRVVRLPYQGHHLSMWIVLPAKRHGLAAVEAKLSSQGIAAWQDKLRSTRVLLHLPRFEFQSKATLTETLPAMGMRDAFDASKADFSGMTQREPLFIGAVLHQAFIAVTESGTEAAAATAVMVSPTGVARPVEPVRFIADQPFLFLIQHRRTGCILFAGRVRRPNPPPSK